MIGKQEICKEHFRIISYDDYEKKKYIIELVARIQSEIDIKQSTKLNFDSMVKDELIKQMENEMFKIVKETDIFKNYIEVLKHQILMRSDEESRIRIMDFFEGGKLL